MLILSSSFLSLLGVQSFTKRNDKQNVLSWYSGMCLKHLLIMELYKYSDAALINFRVDFPLFPLIISWHCPVLSQGNKFEIDRGKNISGRSVRCQARVLKWGRRHILILISKTYLIYIFNVFQICPASIGTNSPRNKRRLPPWLCLVADYIYANAGVEAGDVDNDN